MPYEKTYCATHDEARELIASKRENGYKGATTVGQDEGGWFAAWIVPAKAAPVKETKKPRKETGTDAGLGD